MRRSALAAAVVLLLTGAAPAVSSAPAPGGRPISPPQGRPTATGTGGAVASVDGLASRTAIRVLRDGGNAVDAAVAAAAVLGVTEPFSCGIGGGGFMVVHPAGGGVSTIDHRETAPQAFFPRVFINPNTGNPIPFVAAVTSGLSVGVPGTVRGWEEALRRYGTAPLGDLLRPAIRIAQRGFTIDEPFAAGIEENLERFKAFRSTRELFLTANGDVPSVGSVHRNPDQADTLRRIARSGPDAFYRGPIAGAIVDAVRNPPKVRSTNLRIRPGLMRRSDLLDYDATTRRPTAISYRGFDIYGMAPPSSGGSTVGEALNILEGLRLGESSREETLHRLIESERLAFADRNAYVGDPEYVDVPLDGLLDQDFADVRRREIGFRAAQGIVPPGNPFAFDEAGPGRAPRMSVEHEGRSTTHLTVSDRDGMVVSYTFTIEQIGGSGIVVPGHGFLLNNELTDFEFEPPHPNAPAPGKRPRSSMSPTIVFKGDRPVLALGSPGGATIITTVLQVLVNYLDLGMTLPDAIAAPRVSELNDGVTLAEPAFLASPVARELKERGHDFEAIDELGIVAAVRFFDDGRVQAATEPVRRGGGSALVEERS